MKSVVAWAIRQTPAMNTIMVGVLVVGLAAGFMLRRETFPRFELEIILVTVPYPGASPDEVESGICQKIEEAVQSLEGIKKVTAVAAEGAGSVIIELHSDVPNVQKVLNEVEAEVARIPSFPELAEEPDIKQLSIRNPAIKLGVVSTANDGADAEWQLREMTERVRDKLLLIPEVSVAEIDAAKNYQIDVEISESTLRAHGLTLREVAGRLRQRNLEMPGGNIRDDSNVFLLRGKSKKLTGEEIAAIPLITRPNGATLTVGDLGVVKDDFVDTTSISRINGKPGLAISVTASSREDLLAMANAVRTFSEDEQMPEGYELTYWGDSSVEVQERLDLLRRNGLQGLVLVFLVLALFMELRLSFWVALGIPVSILGACGVLWYFDQTLNMLTMFAFLIALGIVVDDAIVIGENIYAHRQMGKPYFKAAVEGTIEVIPSVSTSVATTVIFFVPMFFVTGVMGKFFAVMPLAVIAMLIISLVESCLILPCHLAHDPDDHRTRLSRVVAFVGSLYPLPWIAAFFRFLNGLTSRFLDGFVTRVYGPVLRFCVRSPEIPISGAVAAFLLSLALVTSSTVPFDVFPKMDAKRLQAVVIFPDGTPSAATDAATKRLEAAILAIGKQETEPGSHPIVRTVHRLVGSVASGAPGGADQRTDGSHAGVVEVELADTTERTIHSNEVIRKWREASGEIAGADQVLFRPLSMGPGGKAIEFKLLAPAQYMTELEDAVEKTKQRLSEFEGVVDISDDSRPGKSELQLAVRDSARSLGVPLETIAQTVRAAYYGEEVMRLQRGRHEVKLMVRYPQEDRRSLANFSNIEIDAGDGVRRPITELAEITVAQGYSEINRLDQKRSITVTADIDESTTANARNIVAELQKDFMPELQKAYPFLHVRWEGQQEQTKDSMMSLGIGAAIALLVTFVLLTLEFTSYGLPLIVTSVIPFGFIGAVLGHAVLEIPITLFSVLGLMALAGVIVNDSIVLVDFINSRIRSGTPLVDAIEQAGVRRFRPVLLTSLTTVAGLLPILTERSFQAQVVIPMATSLCFGLMIGTMLVLLLVPSFYSIYGRLFPYLATETEVPDSVSSNADRSFAPAPAMSIEATG